MTSLSEEQHNYISVMETFSKALLIIVNEIMDYSKFESGRMELENKAFNLRKLLSEVYDLFMPSALSKSLNISIEIDQNIPNALCGDSFKLKQVLSNLQSNAIKFTNQGRIEIFVKTQRSTSEHTLLLEFQVRDSGIGVPKDKLPILFSSSNDI